jgi:hypothetical protein
MIKRVNIDSRAAMDRANCFIERAAHGKSEAEK